MHDLGITPEALLSVDGAAGMAITITVEMLTDGLTTRERAVRVLAP